MAANAWERLMGDPAIGDLNRAGRRVENLARAIGLQMEGFPALADLQWMDRAFTRSGSTYSILVIGQVSSGKSSFINSLLGRKFFLPSDRPTDGVISVLLPVGPDEPERAEKVLRDGTVIAFPDLTSAKGFLRQEETAEASQMACREVRFFLREPWLRHIRLINTPGLGDRLQGFEKATLDFLQEDESDLIVWTFFPESAANDQETGVFATTLTRRSRSVLGVVTRCLEGREDDQDYYPASDGNLAGESGVGPWLRKHLGEYLGEIVFYDSHVARRQEEELRRDPSRIQDPVFKDGLERSGHAHLHRVMDGILGQSTDSVLEAKAKSLLARCQGHAQGLAKAAAAIEAACLEKARADQQEVDAWANLQREVIGPARVRMLEAVRGLADERATEMVTVMGNAAAHAISEEFEILSTLFRYLGNKVWICDSPADALNAKINAQIEADLKDCGFQKRLSQAVQSLALEHLQQLGAAVGPRGASTGPIQEGIAPERGESGQGMDSVLYGALAEVIKAVVAGLLKALAEKMEGKAAEKAASKIAEKAAFEVAEKAAEVAVKQAGKETLATMLTKTLGVVTLVLIPFDLAKLQRDFQKGKEDLTATVRGNYKADQPLYALRLFDTLWPKVEDLLQAVLKEAIEGVSWHKGQVESLLAQGQEAKGLQATLATLAEGFGERARW